MNFDGLWHTTNNYFVLIQYETFITKYFKIASDNVIGWEIPEKPIKINTNGEINPILGYIHTKKRGEEKYVQGSEIEWPKM